MTLEVEYQITVPIPTILKKDSKQLYSLNTHNRTHYRAYSSIKNKFKALYLDELEKHDKIQLHNAQLHYEVFIRNRRMIDLDNGTIFVKKFLQDVMVENGYLIEDSCDILTKNTEVFGGIDELTYYSYVVVTIKGKKYE